jgi:hypothetical protein
MSYQYFEKQNFGHYPNCNMVTRYFREEINTMESFKMHTCPECPCVCDGGSHFDFESREPLSFVQNRKVSASVLLLTIY